MVGVGGHVPACSFMLNVDVSQQPMFDATGKIQCIIQDNAKITFNIFCIKFMLLYATYTHELF